MAHDRMSDTIMQCISPSGSSRPLSYLWLRSSCNYNRRWKQIPDKTKGPANANGNAQQQCMFDSPVKESLSQIWRTPNFSIFRQNLNIVW